MCNNTQRDADIQKDKYIWSYTATIGLACILIYFVPVRGRFFHDFPTVSNIITIASYLVFVWISIWAIILFVKLIKSILKRHWRKAASIIIVPIALKVFFTALNMVNVTPARVYLEYGRVQYLKDVAIVEATGKSPHIKMWYWGDDPSFPAGGTFYYLIYDDSDMTPQPFQSKSNEWIKNFQEETHYEFGNGDWKENCKIKYLDGHFYLLLVSI